MKPAAESAIENAPLPHARAAECRRDGGCIFSRRESRSCLGPRMKAWRPKATAVHAALSRQISIGHIRRRISPSAVATHKQKQRGSAPPDPVSLFEEAVRAARHIIEYGLTDARQIGRILLTGAMVAVPVWLGRRTDAVGRALRLTDRRPRNRPAGSDRCRTSRGPAAAAPPPRWRSRRGRIRARRLPALRGSGLQRDRFRRSRAFGLSVGGQRAASLCRDRRVLRPGSDTPELLHESSSR